MWSFDNIIGFGDSSNNEEKIHYFNNIFIYNIIDSKSEIMKLSDMDKHLVLNTKQYDLSIALLCNYLNEFINDETNSDTEKYLTMLALEDILSKSQVNLDDLKPSKTFSNILKKSIEHSKIKDLNTSILIEMIYEHLTELVN